jgi:hypothetical protein
MATDPKPPRVKPTYTRIRFSLLPGNTQTTIKKALAPLKATALSVQKNRMGVDVAVKIKDPTDAYAVLIARVVAIYPTAAATIRVDVCPANDWAD